MAAKSKNVAVNVGLGIAMCDEKDNLFLTTKGVLEDEIRAGRSLYPRQAKAAKKESCVICLDDDIDFDLMFRVDECGHRFCFNCVKQQIEGETAWSKDTELSWA